MSGNKEMLDAWVSLTGLSDEVCVFAGVCRPGLLDGDTEHPTFRYYNMTSRICVGNQIDQ